MVPQFIAWSLFSLGLFVAIVLTYNELRMNKITIEKQLYEKAERKAILDFLAERKDSIFPLYHKEIKSKEELSEWLKNTQEWVTKTQGDIDKILTPVDASIFRDVSGGSSFLHSRRFNLEHNDELNTLARLLGNLENIIARYPSALIND